MTISALVVTTINPPTKGMELISQNSQRLDAEFILIGDVKSPKSFHLKDSNFYDVEAQLATGFEFAKLCPVGHYARKNIGYLIAMKNGAQMIVETDDDNIPEAAFWNPRNRMVSAPLCATGDWVNVYSYFTDDLIWPRGLPLNNIRRAPQPFDTLLVASMDCPIQQGLANENPDVDAIFRLAFALPRSFEYNRTVILGKGTWCPFNSQNTTFWRDAFPLLYLPYYCSFRMTDIWRSFVAQRLGWECGWSLSFHPASVYQERNEHDLMKDFRDEIPGYLNNEAIRKTLEDLPLKSGSQYIEDNMLLAYKALVDMQVVGAAEIPLLQAWIKDLKKIGI